MPLRAPKGFIDETDPKVCQIGHPAPPWLVNYADLMTELVCFFVILYALSAALNKNVQNAAQQVKDMIDKGQVSGSVKIDQEGLKITLEEKGQATFFKSGSADTTPDIETMMAKLAPTLSTLTSDHDIIVEGHTDDEPIHNQYYDSNWELSTARATSVARLLIDKYGISPKHVAAMGYGQYRPIWPNDTEEHKAKNRRVVFFIKNMPGGALASSAPAPAAPEGQKTAETQSPPSSEAAPTPVPASP